MEFAVHEQAIEDLLGDDSVSQSQRTKLRLTHIGSMSSPNSWLVRKKLDLGGRQSGKHWWKDAKNEANRRQDQSSSGEIPPTEQHSNADKS